MPLVIRCHGPLCYLACPFVTTSTPESGESESGSKEDLDGPEGGQSAAHLPLLSLTVVDLRLRASIAQHENGCKKWNQLLLRLLLESGYCPPYHVRRYTTDFDAHPLSPSMAAELKERLIRLTNIQSITFLPNPSHHGSQSMRT